MRHEEGTRASVQTDRQTQLINPTSLSTRLSQATEYSRARNNAHALGERDTQMWRKLLSLDQPEYWAQCVPPRSIRIFLVYRLIITLNILSIFVHHIPSMSLITLSTHNTHSHSLPACLSALTKSNEKFKNNFAVNVPTDRHGRER